MRLPYRWPCALSLPHTRRRSTRTVLARTPVLPPPALLLPPPLHSPPALLPLPPLHPPPILLPVILSGAKDLPRNSPGPLHPVPSGKTTELDYRANISNHLAEKLYTDAGCRVTEPAYELTHRDGAELMRTRYCIRYELGLCPKFRHRTGQADERTSASDNTKRSSTDAAPLYLLNNGQRFTVLFDCRSCEMVIK